jgi:uncharacterized protein DUF4054
MSNITPSQFRADFPAFASTIRYPDAMVTLWATVAPSLLDANSWGDLFTIGQELFIAHNLVLDGMAGAEAARGGLVGFARGALASETGDKVAVTYQGSAMLEGAGHWNMSTYGMRYWQLMKMVGAGAVQVSPDPFGGALAGPYGWNYGNVSNMQF